jgi:NitT/TauT family transport system substrate-binding protein
MKPRSYRSHIISTLFLVVAALTACGGNAPAVTVLPETTATHIQFSWVHTIEYAGFYTAKANGYFDEENLAVDLRPASFDSEGNLTSVIDEVTSGRADFGVIGSDILMQARNVGQPLVAVAAVYQRLPLILIAMPESGITRPADLVGQTVSLLGNAPAYWDAFFKNANVSKEDVNIIERTDFSTAPLIDGEVDAMDAYLTNQPVALAQQGVDVNRILLSDYAVEGYPNLIFATEATLQERPDLVQRFLRATLHGYQSAIREVEVAARTTLEYNPELAYESELASMELSVRLIVPPNNQIGTMSEDVWRINYELLRDGGLLPVNFDVTAAYDLSFLERIYPSQ